MWTFGRKIAVGFALAFLLLAGIGTVAYRSIGVLTSTSRWITHTHQVLEQIAEVLSLLKDAETGQRGYLIASDETYLEPYRGAIDRLPKVVKELRELTADNANQQRRLDQAEPVIAERFAVLKRIIEVRREAGLEVAAKDIRTGE